ncbi:MAG: hypothetical protein RSA02_01965, partial [Bacteroidales bacterium]
MVKKVSVVVGVWLSVLLQLSGGGFSPLFAQEVVSYVSPKEYQIADISVSGVSFLDNNALVHLSGLV